MTTTTTTTPDEHRHIPGLVDDTGQARCVICGKPIVWVSQISEYVKIAPFTMTSDPSDGVYVVPSTSEQTSEQQKAGTETLHEQRERISTEHGERQRLIDLGLLANPNQQWDRAMTARYEPESTLPNTLWRVLVDLDSAYVVEQQAHNITREYLVAIDGKAKRMENLLYHLRNEGIIELVGGVTFPSIDYRNLVDMIDYAIGDNS